MSPLKAANVGFATLTDQQGHASIGIPFPEAGVYQIATGAPKFTSNVITVTITAADNSGGNTGGGNQATPSSGGDSSASPTATSSKTSAVLGLEDISTSAGSAASWLWILALGVIILLAIIVAVLLVMRRHPREEEYVPKDANDYD